MRNFKIIVEYDGRAYHGWQRQKGLSSIQELLEEGIGRITQEKVVVTGAGRTDAGVHAFNQSAQFKSATGLDEKNILMGLNSILPRDVVVKDLKEVDVNFHARFDVKSKMYMYQIFNSRVRSVLYRDYAWHVRAPLNIEGMEEGLHILKGRHDFSSFCGKKESNADCVRNIMTARIERANHELIRIYLEADGFLRYMVRNIVGTLVEIGMGKRRSLELSTILEAKERKLSGVTAPPQGLFLVYVSYFEVDLR